jgi:hypothetical protein
MLDKLYAISLHDVELDIKGWTPEPTSSYLDTNPFGDDEYPTLRDYNGKYKPSEVNDIFLSLEKYISGLVNNESIKDILVDTLTSTVNLDVVEGGNIIKEPVIQINDYIIFDKETTSIVYYHGRHNSFMNCEFFVENGCRIIETKDSFNFIDYKRVCIDSSGNVLWGMFKRGNNRYSLNTDMIPQINTRKGKIKMVLDGL